MERYCRVYWKKCDTAMSFLSKTMCFVSIYRGIELLRARSNKHVLYHIAEFLDILLVRTYMDFAEPPTPSGKEGRHGGHSVQVSDY